MDSLKRKRSKTTHKRNDNQIEKTEKYIRERSKHRRIKIGLLGYGRTGKSVAEYLMNSKDAVLEFVVKKTKIKKEVEFPIYNHFELYSCIKKYKPDVLIDFSTKEATIANMAVLFDAGFSGGIVIATTGFTEDEIEMLKEYALRFSVVFVPNISDGINIMIKAAKVINKFWDDADVHIIEEHFRDKKNISGTALKIRDVLKKGQIIPVRSGGTVGIHRIVFGRENQKIELTHMSHSREVFAAGALRVAKWVRKKRRGFYTMEDFVES